MPLLAEKDREVVRKRLEELPNPVKLINFTQELECESCKDTRSMLEEVAALSERIELQVFNFQTDKEERDRYGIDKIPATVIMGEVDYGIRYYGIPAGYEFVSLLETLIMVSKRDSGLEPATRERLAQVQEPLRLEVFVTPT